MLAKNCEIINFDEVQYRVTDVLGLSARFVNKESSGTLIGMDMLRGTISIVALELPFSVPPWILQSRATEILENIHTKLRSIDLTCLPFTPIHHSGPISYLIRECKLIIGNYKLFIEGKTLVVFNVTFFLL